MTEYRSKINVLEWRDDGLHLLDQRRLPGEEHYQVLRDAGEIATAVQDMVVRGAPAIGITAAYAVVLSVRQHASESDWRERVRGDIELLEKTRPTAINLRWALVRMAGVLEQVESPDVEAFLAEAVRIHEKDFADNLHMAEAGASLIPEGVNVLTHCNTGALATGGHGTALGVIRTAWGQGKIKHVYVDETRPWLQGSRLTAWELQRDGIPFSVLCEGAAGSLMQQGLVDWVIVGADRIVANGDVANKVGTYNLAVLARHHDLKLMVVAPTSTVDMTVPRGADIPIEYRRAEELTRLDDRPIANAEARAWNPVFDITPAGLIDYIVTETQTVAWPDAERMRGAFR